MGIGDGGGAEGAAGACAFQIPGKYFFFGQMSLKIWPFQTNIKFGNFVILFPANVMQNSGILLIFIRKFSGKNVLPPKLTELLCLCLQIFHIRQ